MPIECLLKLYVIIEIDQLLKELQNERKYRYSKLSYHKLGCRYARYSSDCEMTRGREVIERETKHTNQILLYRKINSLPEEVESSLRAFLDDGLEVLVDGGDCKKDTSARAHAANEVSKDC